MSDQFATHAALKKYLPLFHSMFDAHHEGVLIADMQGRIVYYNQAQSRIDEILPEKALGGKMCEVYNIRLEASPTMQVLRTGQPAFDDVHFYRTRYGRLVNSVCHIYPLVLEGELCAAVSFIQEYSVMEMEAVEPPKAPLMALSVRPKAVEREQGRRFADIVGKSKALRELVATARLAAKTPSPVMLIGETGVGKEVFARAVHGHSQQRQGPFTAINCAAVPETLLEGILFGTTKGAFTGAVDKAGLLENSDGGTVFLDEADSMPLGLQSKLLRVLQDFRVRRVGDFHERTINVKIISSVSRPPSECIAGGTLRQDFYYRLGVVQLMLPPLRERMEDLPLLVHHFIAKYSTHLGMAPPLISPELMAEFYCYSWPGNVRELEHVIEAGLNILGEDQSMSMEHIRRVCPDFFSHALRNSVENRGKDPCQRANVPITLRCSAHNYGPSCVPFSLEGPACGGQAPSCGTGGPGAEARPETAMHRKGGLSAVKNELERQSIYEALHATAGNKGRAARLLGISPQLLSYKLRKYRIEAESLALQ